MNFTWLRDENIQRYRTLHLLAWLLAKGPFDYNVSCFWLLGPPTSLMIYSTVNHQKLPFSDPTHPPLWWRNTWMLPNVKAIYKHSTKEGKHHWLFWLPASGFFSFKVHINPLSKISVSQCLTVMPEPGGSDWPPPIFGRSVNPIPTGEGRLFPPITTGTPNVFHLPSPL